MFYSLLYPQHSALCLIVVEWIGHVRFFAAPWTEACQASLCFAISWSLLKLVSIELVTLFLRTSRCWQSDLWFLYWCSCSLTESCTTLCDPVDCSPPSFPVHGLSQAWMLKWVAISFSRDLPDPGIEPASSALAGDSLPVSHLGSPLCLVLSMKEKKCCPVFSVNTDVTAIGLHITDVLKVSPEGSQDRNQMPGI